MKTQSALFCLSPVLLDFKTFMESLTLDIVVYNWFCFLQYMIGFPYPLNKRLSGGLLFFLKVYAGAEMILLVCILYVNLLQTKEAHQRFPWKEEWSSTQNKFHRCLE